MRGRPPKPTALKIVEGDAHKAGARKLQEKLDREPKPTPGVPRMPANLTAGARRMWKQLVPELDRLGLLTQVDAGALEGACTAYGRAVAADKIIAKEGLTVAIFETVEESEGKTRPVLVEYRKRLEIAISFEAWKQFKAFCTEFGLTPASRSRISLKSDNVDDLAELLSMPREPRTA